MDVFNGGGILVEERNDLIGQQEGDVLLGIQNDHQGGVKVFGAHNGGVIFLAEGGKGRGGRSDGGREKGLKYLMFTHTRQTSHIPTHCNTTSYTRTYTWTLTPPTPTLPQSC